MATVLLYFILVANAIIALAFPWVGIVLAYLLAILTPQNIWYWAFEGLRPVFWILVPTSIGLVLAILRKRLDFGRLRAPGSMGMVILWIAFTVAYYLGPYVDVVNEWRFNDPHWFFPLLQKTFLTYFLALVLLDRLIKIRVAALVLVVTVIYMTYWANAQYLFYGKFGRIGGPAPFGSGVYADENVFAVLFVVGAPFLYYAGLEAKSRLLRYALWAVIPFSWHAIFLTASRGALLATGLVMLIFFLRSGNKKAGVIVLLAFVAAFAWQAGDVMKERSATIASYDEDASAEGRLDAWQAATGMMLRYPLTGVGFQSMGQAFPDFSSKRPRVAHNTFFQMGSEWGPIAGATYLGLMLLTLLRLHRNGVCLRPRMGENVAVLNLYHLNEACLLGLAGMFACSMLLSLQNFELLYFLLLLSNLVLLQACGDGSFASGSESGRLGRSHYRATLPTGHRQGLKGRHGRPAAPRR